MQRRKLTYSCYSCCKTPSASTCTSLSENGSKQCIGTTYADCSDERLGFKEAPYSPLDMNKWFDKLSFWRMLEYHANFNVRTELHYRGFRAWVGNSALTMKSLHNYFNCCIGQSTRRSVVNSCNLVVHGKVRAATIV